MSEAIAQATAFLGVEPHIAESQIDRAEQQANHDDMIADFLNPALDPVEEKPVSRMIAALRAEGRRVAREVHPRYRLIHGNCVGTRGDQYVYQFQWSRAPESGQPGELRIGRLRAQASVSRSDSGRERVHELLVNRFIGATVSSARFIADPTFLLRLVHDHLRRLEEKGSVASRCAENLLQAVDDTGPFSAVGRDSTYSGLNQTQADALHMAIHSPRSYIWGPPGTGKTRVLGELVRTLRERGKKVLILASYNVAVDQLLLATEDGEGSEAGLLRVGLASDRIRDRGLDVETHLERIAAESGLLSIARSLARSLHAEGDALRSQPLSTVRECLEVLGSWVVSRSGKSHAHASAVDAARRAIRAQFRSQESQVIAGAQVVATTVTLRLLHPQLSQTSFDHIVIDEGSVVRTPEAVVSWGLSPSARLTVAGDPMQLPAIVKERVPLVEQWLGRNPFALAGIRRPADARGSCIMLHEQYRMAPAIRTIVSDQFYDGILRDGVADQPPGHVILFDTSHPKCQSSARLIGGRYSKENLFHRGLVNEAIRSLRRTEPTKHVLVLTPFTAQKSAYLQEHSTRLLRPYASFETIHSSQGSERDSVIIDFVLAGTGSGLRSRMLRERGNPYLANLLNVALSRAKHRLVIFADLTVMEEELGHGVFQAIIDRACAVGNRVRLGEPAPLMATIRRALLG